MLTMNCMAAVYYCSSFCFLAHHLEICTASLGIYRARLPDSFVNTGSLNFRDVMLAYGKLSKQQMAHESGGDNIGFEFSGTSVSSLCLQAVTVCSLV